GEPPGVLGGAVPALPWNVNLDALLPAGLHAAGQAVAGERVAEQQGDPAAVDDRGRGAGVEVEDERVRGERRAVRADPPHRDVDLQRGQVGAVDQGGQIGDERAVAPVALFGAALGREGHGTDPVGGVRGGVLLVEALPAGAVRVARDGERPVPQVREHHRRDPGVVVDDLRLGEAGVGVEDLVQVAQGEVTAVHPYPHVRRHLRLLPPRGPARSGDGAAARGSAAWYGAAAVGTCPGGESLVAPGSDFERRSENVSMRSIWKGAISFGLVTIPVKLYPATEQKDVTFHQVHRTDGGRIKYKRVCSVDGAEVPYGEIAKGYELPTGEVVILTDEDFAELPLSTSRRIDVLQFTSADQIDPIYFAKSYYLEPEAQGTKAYVLL